MKTFVGLTLFFTCATAHAFVTRIEITRREPAFENASFGKVGPYEKLVGTYWAELDPTNARNAVIVDLDKAPRNERGRVEYSAEFYILKPQRLEQANGTLLYEIADRGTKGALWKLNGSPFPPNVRHSSVVGNNDPTSLADAGDGFLMRHGYTVVWSGVYGDVTHAFDPNALTITLPIAKNADGSPIEGETWDECNFSRQTSGESRCKLSYPVPDLDQAKATLLMRERRSDSPVEIPRAQWAFDGRGAIQLLPSGKVFEPGLIYQLIHRAQNPPVMGIGLAGIRDFVSFLRDAKADMTGQASPLGGTVKSALIMGWSQSGRMTREFIYRGFNENEATQGKKVFDGAMPIGAGTRPFVNFRFAQPDRAPDKQHGTIFYPDSSFPFAYDVQEDSLSSKTDGILRRCTQTKTCPKVFHVSTSNEYWHYKNSPVTTDTLGTRDAILPTNVRAYHLAGMAHAPYAVNDPGVAEQPHNAIRFTYLLRNLLTKLNDWSRAEKAPPASAIPKISDKTLVDVASLTWPHIPAVTFPALTPHHLFDYGPDFERGIVKVLPQELKADYPPRVPQVDQDGNDIAGIRHPAVSVPLATRTGWSVTATRYGRGELASQDGSFIVFPRTQAERLQSGDPRLSIEERYKDRRDYESRVRQAARALVGRGFLLAEDEDGIVAQCRDEWSKVFPDRHGG